MRRGTWASVLAVLALAVAGCSEPEQPSTSLPTAASTSAEPTLEPLGPADFPVPAEARQESEVGATAAAQYYLELTFRAAQTLDTTWLSELSQGCANCDADVSSYEEDRAAGNRYEGGEASVTTFFDSVGASGQMSVGAAVTRTSYRVIDGNGEPVAGRESASLRLSGGLTLSWSSERSAWITNSLLLEVAQ